MTKATHKVTRNNTLQFTGGLGECWVWLREQPHDKQGHITVKELYDLGWSIDKMSIEDLQANDRNIALQKAPHSIQYIEGLGQAPPAVSTSLLESLFGGRGR